MTNGDPWDEWMKRRRSGSNDPFEGFFPPEFQQEFDRMREYMNRVMQDMMRGFTPPTGEGGAPGQPGEPFVYGFSVRMGPDGKPQFQQFGNTNPVNPAAQEGAREPLTDVLTDDKQVAVTIELPGVGKEDINLHVAEDVVTIRVDTGRKYYKQIQLPMPVVPNTASATFKNGILDLTIDRQAPRHDPGHKVDIH